MNNHLLIVGMAVLFILVVGLSGCQDTGETGDIIGTWKYETSIIAERTWTL